MKTSNKLIGEIENNQLYDSDDVHEINHGAKGNLDGESNFIGLDIDYGQNTNEQEGENKNINNKKALFLQKMKSKKEQEEL